MTMLIPATSLTGSQSRGSVRPTCRCAAQLLDSPEAKCPCRHTPDDSHRSHILRDHCASCDDSSTANCDAGQHHYMCTQPHIVLYPHGLRLTSLTRNRHRRRAPVVVIGDEASWRDKHGVTDIQAF